VSRKIIVVDDEPNVRVGYRITLETEGFTVCEAGGAGQALEALDSESFDLALLDIRMPEMDGLDLLAAMRERGLNTPTVIITAYGDIPKAVRAMKLGALDFLEKPLTPEILRNIVGEIFARRMAIEPCPSADDFGSHFTEAKRLINLRTFGPAWTHLSRALELSPGSAAALYLAGVLFEMQGDRERAGKLYEKAIKSQPDYKPAQQSIPRLLDLYKTGSDKEPFNPGA
jgi:DNA-binding response OmpR family regulator